MEIADSPLMTMLKRKMSWLGARQTVLSQNIANADTPQYTPSELKPIDFEKTLRSAATPSFSAAGTLLVTNPNHIAVGPKHAGYQDYDVRDKATDPLGNAVSLEQEMIKVADTQAQFQAASNLYSKALGMMRTAIGKGG
jgi:flagellar basal-body rod protein FlgB